MRLAKKYGFMIFMWFRSAVFADLLPPRVSAGLFNACEDGTENVRWNEGSTAT